MNPAAEFPLKELTTAEIWDRLHAQVFVVINGVYVDQCYIIHDGTISPLGESFGGSGVMSMCVSDLAGDGRPRLVFSYSWGSGIHRSLVGVWTGAASWVDAKEALRDYDVAVEKIDDSHVRVVYGNFDAQTRNFDRLGEFGTVRFTTEATGGHLDIVLSPELPNEVLNRVWK